MLELTVLSVEDHSLEILEKMFQEIHIEKLDILRLKYE